MHTAAILGRRTCAALAATSAVLHAVLLGHAGNPVTAGLMLAMIAGCLFCARELWSTGTLRVWCAVALMNLAMVALHMPAPGHHHGGTHAALEQSAVMTTATVLALVEAAVATAVVYCRTRNRTAELSDTPVRSAATPAPAGRPAARPPSA